MTDLDRRGLQAIRALEALRPHSDVGTTVVTWCDDGAIVFEGISENHRLGFSIEADPNESGWYYASKPMNDLNGSGLIDGTDLHEIVAKVLAVMRK